MSGIAQGQEYFYMQDFSSLSIRNPAFTGVMQTPGLIGRFEREGRLQHGASHYENYIAGYEQQLSEKAGSIGCRVLTKSLVTTIGTYQVRQLHFQYANCAKGEKGDFLFGARVGIADEITRYRYHLRPDSKTGTGLYTSMGAAVSTRHFFIGTSLMNFYSYGLSKRAYASYAAPVFSLQSAGFFEANPENPRIFITPSLNLDISGEGDVRASLKLNAASPHISAGAGIYAGEEDEMVEVSFGYIGKRFRVGYSLACPTETGRSSNDLIFDLHFAYFFTGHKEQTQGDRAYYFRHLF